MVNHYLSPPCGAECFLELLSSRKSTFLMPHFLHHLPSKRSYHHHLRFVGVTTVVTFSGPLPYLITDHPLLVVNKAWQSMNFSKLLHHFCVMHQISGYLCLKKT